MCIRDSLVSGTGDTDGAFRSREGLMARQESEALGLFSEEHGAQITAVSYTHLYLTKPFAMGELLARVRAMTRRRADFSPDALSLSLIHI